MLPGCDVIDVQAEPGPGPVRLFLGRGVDPEAVAAVPGLAPRRVLVLGGSLVITSEWDGQGAMPLPLRGRAERLEPARPEPEILAGRDVLLATRNGESADLVADWLAYHAARHDIGGAVILDRLRPGEARLDLAGAPCPVIVVTSPVPLGHDEPSERGPHLAPEAPGRGRLPPGPHDPWTARLGQLCVLEALRWRFLSRARGVAWIDVSDLLAPEAAPFARLAQAASGVVPLEGRRIYPWRVRRGAPPALGDHVCAPFEPVTPNRRWAAAPARLPEEAPFRMVRVGHVTPDGPAVPFLRAMAARHGEAGDAPLAPRAALRVEDDLLALARDGFGHDPVLPPRTEAEAFAPRLPAALPGRTAIVTCMRNEGPFILDWLAHHRAIGVDDVLVYTNDCTDGTDALLDLLQSHGIVQHRANPFRGTGLKPQHAALAAAEEEAVIARAGWVICMDVDEFLNIHVGQGTLPDLYAAVGDANLISATWRLFGNADLSRFEDVPVPARFDACAPRMIRKPHQAWGFKTLARNLGIFRKLGVHRPKGLNPEMWDRVVWVNGSGQPMPREMLRSGWRSTVETVGYDLVTLNHYAVRDAESFLVKRDRGRVNHVDRDQGLGYWFRMNNNAERDGSLQERMPCLMAERDALMALPGVAAQHAACVAAHRAKIAELRERPDYAALYEALISERMRRLSRMHEVFGANVFLAGPDTVPDEVAFGDHPEGFFFTVGEVDETAH
ncbi:glycosyltransferase family 2 protein [Jannaschia seohaensis]|uniref:Glycosyl transferase family 2 n=1 Tax=Jannaschia seohaensis TaxID=475081 RepID=A0A2Y9AN38_9RHOB|nr:glycosyltransferase family 2 protein [Jannaschia seohaensis]PWJ19282.1 glycosyl transferase family 2 [Jannaschia seohaensis]SSA45944.1 Glycosyl transferase family 2 [Jannaschia seohaensis]